MCYLHYPRRILGFGPVLIPGDDAGADMAAIGDFYRPFRGRRPAAGKVPHASSGCVTGLGRRGA